MLKFYYRSIKEVEKKKKFGIPRGHVFVMICSCSRENIWEIPDKDVHIFKGHLTKVIVNLLKDIYAT